MISSMNAMTISTAELNFVIAMRGTDKNIYIYIFMLIQPLPRPSGRGGVQTNINNNNYYLLFFLIIEAGKQTNKQATAPTVFDNLAWDGS